jgi:uncharacterized protein YcfJ
MYTDPHSKFMSYVTVLPAGRAFFSDARGSTVRQPHAEADAEVAGTIVAGTLGALAGGPVGSVVGAVAGAIAGKMLKKTTGVMPQGPLSKPSI